MLDPHGAETPGPTALSPALEGLDVHDRAGLLRALELGRRGWGRVQPNPLVGCVIVREGQVVGEGWHREFGGPHAEVEALAEAGESAREATAYVSLEPCAHYGKTPPCTLALLDAGIRRVVYGAPDPGEVSGGGAETLRRAGVQVVGPCLSAEDARRENPAFFHRHRSDRPWLALKLALSLDGMISQAPGSRTLLTGPEAGAWVHRLRSGFDAILVGSGTIRVDDPLLTVRASSPPIRPPARLVLDRTASLSGASRVMETAGEAPVVVFVAEDVGESKIERLEGLGAIVHPVPSIGGRLSFDALLEVCRETGIHSVLCEGGGVLASGLLGEGKVDRLHLIYSPRTLGPSAVPGFPEPIPGEAWDGWVPVGNPIRLGRDVLITLDRLNHV